MATWKRTLTFGFADNGSFENGKAFVMWSEYVDHPRPVIVGNALSFFQVVDRQPDMASVREQLGVAGIYIAREAAFDHVAGFQFRELYRIREDYFDIEAGARGRGGRVSFGVVGCERG